jgi:hypothetical protein
MMSVVAQVHAPEGSRDYGPTSGLPVEVSPKPPKPPPGAPEAIWIKTDTPSRQAPPVFSVHSDITPCDGYGQHDWLD